MEKMNKSESLDDLIKYLTDKLNNRIKNIDQQEIIDKFDRILELIINKNELNLIKLFYQDIYNKIKADNPFNQNEKNSYKNYSKELAKRFNKLENKIKDLENKNENKNEECEKKNLNKKIE